MPKSTRLTRCRQRVGSAAVDLDQLETLHSPLRGHYFFGVTGCRFCDHIKSRLVCRSLVTGEVITMRRRLIILTFATLIVPAFASEALATTADIRSITCSEYLAMPAAPSSKFSAWMTGWFSYESRRTFVDFDLHRTNVTNVRGWCQSNPSASVMVGLEKSIGVTAVPNATLDFNKITCGTWLGYGPADQDFVRYFMSGYYNAAASNSVLDYDRLQKNSSAVVAYCKKNKSRTLPTAIQKRAS